MNKTRYTEIQRNMRGTYYFSFLFFRNGYRIVYTYSRKVDVPESSILEIRGTKLPR